MNKQINELKALQNKKKKHREEHKELPRLRENEKCK